MGRSLSDPGTRHALGGKTIPDSIEFNSMISTSIIAEKLRRFQAWRIEPLGSLPGFVGVAG
jgi:hypothetical protein